MVGIIMFLGFAFCFAVFGCIVLIFQLQAAEGRLRVAKSDAYYWEGLCELEQREHLMSLKSHRQSLENLYGIREAENMKVQLEQMQPEQFRVV